MIKNDLRPKANKQLSDKSDTTKDDSSDIIQELSKNIDLNYYNRPESGEDKSNIFSYIIFNWLNPIIALGYSRPLEENDLPHVANYNLAYNAHKLFSQKWNQQINKYNQYKDNKLNKTNNNLNNNNFSKSINLSNDPAPNLLKAVFNAFGFRFMMASLCKIIADGLGFVSPYLLSGIITFISDSQNINNEAPSLYIGYLYCLGLFLVSILSIIMMNEFTRTSLMTGLQVRTALVIAIYQKSLRLSASARAQTPTGKIVNLMSTDSSKIDQTAAFAHYAWTTPLQVSVAIILLVLQIGVASTPGIALILLFVPIQWLFTRLLTSNRVQAVKKTDLRLKIMNEILQGIKVIKVYAWETSFLKSLKSIRMEEMSFISVAQYIRGINGCFNNGIPPLMVYLPYMTLALLSSNGTLDSASVFSSLVLFNIIRIPVIILPMVFGLLAEAHVSFKRIEAFLLSEELDNQPLLIQDLPDQGTDTNPSKVDGPVMDPSIAISFRNASFTWATDPMETSALLADPQGVPHLPPNKHHGAENGNHVDSINNKPADYNTTAFQLKNINLEIKKGSLTVIIGSVGSGKSSFLQGLIGEMKRYDGSVIIRGNSVSYCPQLPWIQNSTLRDNILFGKPFNQDKYDQVLKACALVNDLKVLPAGDQTEIGERGINLSGGQKQRVSLARAVYFDAEVTILDDTLSAVDAHVGAHLFHKCIRGALKNKTRVLVTHQLQFVPYCDRIILLRNGRIVEDGTFDELMVRSDPFRETMESFGGVIGKPQELDESELEQQEQDLDQPLVKLNNSEGKVDTTNVSDDSNKSKLQSTEGGLTESKTDDYVNMVIDPQLVDSVTTSLKNNPETIISPTSQSTTNTTTKGSSLPLLSTTTTSPSPSPSGTTGNEEITGDKPAVVGGDIASNGSGKVLMSKEDRSTGTVGFHVWKYYLDNAGGFGVLILFLFLVGGTVSLRFVCDFFLAQWSINAYPSLSLNQYLIIYAILTGVQIIFAIGFNIMASNRGVITSIRLHDRSIQSLLQAPMSFFDTTPLGRIVNRFSRDQDIIDNMLALENLRYLPYWILLSSGVLILISIFNPWFTFVVPVISYLYIRIQAYYRASSRELKRLESISRSPLFAHFSETLSGLSTVRAYRAETMFMAGNLARMDGNNRPYVLLQCSNRWLGQRLEFLGSLVVLATALVGVSARSTISPGIVGLSLSYAFQITYMITFLVRCVVDTENNMNSVERCKFYTDSIDREAESYIPSVDDILVSSNWPAKGTIDINNLCLRYRPGLPLVLNNLSVHIEAGHRIGVVGRTGAGKSSLMLALYRLVEPEPYTSTTPNTTSIDNNEVNTNGQILIDGVDITRMGTHTLRSRLSIMPQDPVLFSGTIRSNLDPFNEHTDNELWSALERAYLKDAVLKLDASGKGLGLLAPVTESGENMSVGQRCQICLARAMLRNKNILIMDEATASIDLETDSLIQRSLRRFFKNVTILTIAHRLNTIMDYDKVMVLSFGKIIEYDSPANLIRNEKSEFLSMINETGEINSALLKKIAFAAEEERKKMNTLSLMNNRNLNDINDDDVNNSVTAGLLQVYNSMELSKSRLDHNQPLSTTHVKWHY